MKGEKLFIKGDFLHKKGDFKTAFVLFQKGADMGHKACMSRLAEMYNCGEAVTQDYEKALSWHKKASEDEDSHFLRSVANTYRLIGNITNYKIWLEKAYAGGDGDAALQLAKLYMISDKEINLVKKYLEAAIHSSNIFEESVDEAKYLLEKLDAVK